MAPFQIAFDNLDVRKDTKSVQFWLAKLSKACVPQGQIGKDCRDDAHPLGKNSIYRVRILFEDAFDVASFLDSSEDQHMPNISSVFPNCNPENPEEKFQLYLQIIEFFKSLCCPNTPVNQEPDPLADDDLMLLKCLETFDDEDL
ncbi:hypothetical protein U0070_014645 [Myodes glareolus]|uniref:DUF4485 domain-containing protein n=1 Tax=Myodes glareolus TaxID=447135 RepID=A0AAW0IU86_MYOGA